METAPETPQTNPTPPTVQAHEHQAFLPAFSLFSPSLEALKKNLGTFIALILAPFVLMIPMFIMLFSSLGSIQTYTDVYGNVHTTGGGSMAGFWVVWLAVVVISLVVGPAVVATQLAGAKGEKLPFGDALKIGLKRLFPYLGLSILSAIIIWVGLILLIVPGIFAIQRLLLAQYFLLDGKSVTASLSASFKAGKQYSGPMWGLLGATFVFGLVSGVPLIGWIVSLMYSFAPAVRYLEVKKAGIDGKTA
jgi:hypothetical protein